MSTLNAPPPNGGQGVFPMSTLNAPSPDGGQGVTDVFISYSRADESWVASDLEPWLRENGYKVYRDNQIPGGANVIEWIRTKSSSAAT